MSRHTPQEKLRLVMVEMALAYFCFCSFSCDFFCSGDCFDGSFDDSVDFGVVDQVSFEKDFGLRV